MKRVIGTAVVALLLGACKKDAPASNDGQPAEAATRTAAGPSGEMRAAERSVDRNDPCRYVTRAEAEKWLGPLARDPYRAGSGKDPAPNGGTCQYRAPDGRSIQIELTREGGKGFLKMAGLVGKPMGKVFGDESGKADLYEGKWDDTRWGMGQLMALKGDSLFTVTVRGWKASVKGAADLAAHAVDRLDQPLDYDGAAAARSAPATPPEPDACSWLTRAEVEAVVGPLSGDPVAKHSDCDYPVAGEQPIELSVTWKNGFDRYFGGLITQGMIQDNVVAPSTQMAAGTQEGVGAKPAGAAGAAKDDRDANPFVGALGQMMGSKGLQMQPGTLTPKTELNIPGPWAEGSMVFGGAFYVVQQDVMFQMTTGPKLTQDGAKTLLGKAVGRVHRTF